MEVNHQRGIYIIKGVRVSYDDHVATDEEEKRENFARLNIFDEILEYDEGLFVSSLIRFTPVYASQLTLIYFHDQ